MKVKKLLGLKRVLGLHQVIFYGLGTIMGAGIYVLVGKVPLYAGIYAPVAFLAAGILAALSALSYAELSSRFPRSVGAAGYTQEGFHTKHLSILVGLGIALTGIVSSAVLARGFAGYLKEFIDIPEAVAVVLIVLFMGGLAIWGIEHSIKLITIATIIAIAGLLLVILGAGKNLGAWPELWSEMGSGMSGNLDWGILSAMVLAFFAFIGFEDIANIAEETKKLRHVLPWAMVICLSISVVVYMAIIISAILTLPLEELTQSGAPLALLFERATGWNPAIITITALLAVSKGIVAQTIMSSRALYGMSAQGWLPRILSLINQKTRTPLWATLMVMAMILILALCVPIVPLANLTSMVVLIIFAINNVALLRIKMKDGHKEGTFRVPIWVPALGFLANAGIVVYKLVSVI